MKWIKVVEELDTTSSYVIKLSDQERQEHISQLESGESK